MEQGGVTWIVTVDAREARVFAERVRAGALKELPALRMTAKAAEGPTQPPRGTGRRDAGDPSLGDEAAKRFLKRVATRLMVSASQGDFDRLALMAPPHTLGLLRKALAPAVAARVDVTDDHERVGDGAEDIRARLREARARTWSPVGA